MLKKATVGKSTVMIWEWEKSAFIPQVVDRTLGRVSFLRAHFIESGRVVGAGSIVDGEVVPESVLEMLAYLPRALFVGLFSPFPDTWAERPTLPRVIGAIETLVFYLMFPGILILTLRCPSRVLFVCLIVSAAIITVLSYVSPNVGTLHRIRYGPLFVFMLAGAGGWAWLLGQAFGVRGYFVPPPSAVLADSVSQSSGIDNPSGRRALGAGAMVTLISIVGFLGLLIRDLLLINRVGFGTNLDSFYLAMMVPMLFVSVLALPMGDALTTTIHRLKDRTGIQSLLGAVSVLTLIFFAVLGIALLLGADRIYRAFVITGEIEEIVVLFPIAILLFVFSGAVVSGNSLVNSLGRPVFAATAQLSVPVTAVSAIFLAGDTEIIKSATIGMVAGQLVNLVILYLIARRNGYLLFSGSLGEVWRARDMLVNYLWLVFAALLSSLLIPVNYWFAGRLGAGAISTWAVGSKLVQMATGLGVALMTAVLVPYLSKLVAVGWRSRIRNDVYVSLMLGGWGGVLVALIIFGFAEPIVVAALPEGEQVAQLVGVVKLGALQLPFVISSLLLSKLAAVSEVSIKTVVATLIGLLANIVLNLAWMPVWGLQGLAASWAVSGLLTSVVIMMVTRTQSHMGFAELLSIAGTWFVLGGAALAIHVKSPAAGVGVIIVFAVVLRGQWMIFGASRN